MALERLAAFVSLLELEEFAAFELLIASFVGVELLWLVLDVLSSCTSPFVEPVVVAPGETLPVLGTHGAAAVTPLRAAALSAGKLPDATAATRLPVVVVSAPTPEAPLVAFRPLKRWSGLVDVLFGVVVAATPAVVPASVGVPVAVVGAVVVGVVVVTPVVAAAPDGPYVVLPLAPAVADDVLGLTCIGGQGLPVERCPALPPVSVCCALAPTATAVLNSMAIPAMRHRTMRSVRSAALVICAS